MKAKEQMDKSVLKLMSLMTITPVIEILPEKTYEIKIPKRSDLKMGQRLTPLSDRIFKIAFQNEEYKDFACKLISCLTGIDCKYLQDNLIFYKNNINETVVKEVQRVGDMLIKVGNVYYQVEMNNYQALGRNIKSSILASTIRTDNKRDVAFLVVEIGLNNYRLRNITDSINIYACKNILTEKDNEILLKSFYIEVFLPIIMEKAYNKLNKTEKILRAMFTPSADEGKRLAKGDEILMRYSEVMEELVDNPILMEGYDIEGSNREHLEMKYKKEGREENTKEIISNMLSDNLNITTIAKYVNLKVEEVEKIVLRLRESEITNR